LTIHRTLKLAAQHSVTVGAHPAYPDLVGFGRRSMNLSAEEIVAAMLYQISALDGMATSLKHPISYVKPHGALYNDMMAKRDVRAAIIEALVLFHRPLILMLQATPEAPLIREEAASAGLNLSFEAFADRCYDDDGKLLARSKPGAVHDREKMLAQVTQLRDRGCVTTVSGHQLVLEADTLCVHGDNMEGVRAIAEIRALIDGA